MRIKTIIFFNVFFLKTIIDHNIFSRGASIKVHTVRTRDEKSTATISIQLCSGAVNFATCPVTVFCFLSFSKETIINMITTRVSEMRS